MMFQTDNYIYIYIYIQIQIYIYIYTYIYIYIYIFIYIYIYTNRYTNIYKYIYTNLPVKAIVRLPHPRSRDSQGHETFFALSADKQTSNYDTRVLKPPSLPINTKVKGIVPQQDEMVSYIYKFTSKCHSQTTPSQGRRQPG